MLHAVLVTPYKKQEKREIVYIEPSFNSIGAVKAIRSCSHQRS